jgi:hypothetical protein
LPRPEVRAADYLDLDVAFADTDCEDVAIPVFRLD